MSQKDKKDSNFQVKVTQELYNKLDSIIKSIKQENGKEENESGK